MLLLSRLRDSPADQTWWIDRRPERLTSAGFQATYNSPITNHIAGLPIASAGRSQASALPLPKA